MSDEELIRVLKEFETTRVEKLNDNSKKLFYAIMKIADERDNLKEENQRLNNVLNELEKIANGNIEALKNRLSTPFCNFEKATKELMIHNNYLDKINELKESDK